MTKPGEVYWARSTQGGDHPFIVVGRPELYRGKYLLVVPVTSQKVELRAKLPNCVHLRKGQFGFTKDCVAQAEALTLIERDELDLAQGPSGRIDAACFRDLIKAIAYALEADCEPL